MSEKESKPQPTNPAQRAATNCWQLAIVVALVLMLGGRLGMRLIMDVVALLIILSAIGAGIYALCGVRKHGAPGILRPALVGLCIHLALLLIFAMNFSSARDAARTERDGGYRLQETGADSYSPPVRRNPSPPLE